MKHYECRACMVDGDEEPCTLSYHDDTGDEPIVCPYGYGSAEPKWTLIDPDGKKDWLIECDQDWAGCTIQLVDVYTNNPITWVAAFSLDDGVLILNTKLQANLEDGGYTTGKLKFTDGLLETRTL